MFLIAYKLYLFPGRTLSRSFVLETEQKCSTLFVVD